MSSSTANLPQPLKGAAKHWTYEEYYRLTPESHDERYEIDNGELVPMPAPTVVHQRIIMELAHAMDPFTKEHALGEIFISPLDVIFDDDNTAQPDLLFVTTARKEIIKERGVFGAPDMVVEVLSPSSTRRDREEKSTKYLRFMVQEYWLVNPIERSIEVRIWRGDYWAVHSLAREIRSAESLILPGFSLDLTRVFAA